MSSFRDLLPPDVRDEIAAKEAAGVSFEEQGRERPEPPRQRPIAPPVEEREMDALFGVTEDPQTGYVHLKLVEGGQA